MEVSRVDFFFVLCFVYHFSFIVLVTCFSSVLDVELDMEELYAKPIKEKKKYQAKTRANEYERILLPGYDQVGTIIAGTYERRDSYGSDTELINNPVDRTNSVKLDFLNNAGIQDVPYEIIGKKSSFKAELKKESYTSTQKPRSDVQNNEAKDSQESIDKIDSAVTFKPDDKNGGVKRLSSFKPEGSIRQQRTSIRREKLDNPVLEKVQITPPLSRDGSPLRAVRIEKEGIASADQNQKNNKTKRNNKSNSYENVTGINLNTSNGLTNDKDKSHSYEEIFNEDSTKTGILENLNISNSQGNCLDSPYESIPNTNNEIGKSKDDLQTSFLKTENKLNLESSKNENDTDSGYEEIWSNRKNSADNNIEADDAKKQVKSPHYMEIETISSGKTFKKAEDSHYVDVYLK